MVEPGGAQSVPGCSGVSLSTGRGLPGRVRSLSSPTPPGRLTSLRTRDLTLGGAFKKNKKVFEPNVHAVRKSKDELKQELCVASKKERRERNERRRESRGRRRERPQTIQSHSIFEQGPADTGRKTGWCAKDLQYSSTSTVCKLVKKERKEPEEEEEGEEVEEILNKLQRDDSQPGFSDERTKIDVFRGTRVHYSGPHQRSDAGFLGERTWVLFQRTQQGSKSQDQSDGSPANSSAQEKLTAEASRLVSRVTDRVRCLLSMQFIDDPGLRNDDRLKPIQLPLCQCSSLARTYTPATTTSAGAEGGVDASRTEQPSLVRLLHDLCLSEKEELFFMQLPDCMPARMSPPRADKPAEKEAKSDHHRTAHLQAQETLAKDSCPPLSHFPEGLLGKLQIRKSGKVDLKLGDIILNVSEGAAFSFLQQLVSVRLSEGRTGDMMELGNVHHKLVLSPDFQVLLHQAGAEQSQC